MRHSSSAFFSLLGQVTGGEVLRSAERELRALGETSLECIGTARVEEAALRQVERIGELAPRCRRPRPPCRVELRGGGEKGLGIGVTARCKQRLARAELDQLAGI